MKVPLSSPVNGRKWEKNGISLAVPFSEPGVSTMMLLHHGERYSIIDCGDGAATYLHSLFGNERRGYDAVADIMLTHEHLDHCGGIPALLMLFEIAGRSTPLTIVSPCGESGIAFRIVSIILDRLHFKISFRNILGEPAKTYQSGDAGITAFKTKHRDSSPANRCGDTVPSSGYVFRYGGVKIVFSGDTGPLEALNLECKGADLAVIESTWEEPKECEDLHHTVTEAIRTGSAAREAILMHPLRDGTGKRLASERQ